MEPLVSIFIPTRNRVELLPKCIQSIIDQTYQNWELLVIDDVSTDRTVDLLKDITEREKRIKYITNRENLGPYLSKGPYLLRAEGKYLATLDDDDYWLPNNLERKIKAMEVRPWCKVCYSDCWRFDRKNRKRYWDCSRGKPFPNILSPTTILRTDEFQRLGGLDSQFTYYHAELDYFLRLGYRDFLHIPEALAVTTCPANSMAQEGRLEDAHALEAILAKHWNTISQDKKRLAYYLTRIGLHRTEGGMNGRSFFWDAVKTYKRSPEAWWGLICPSRSLLLWTYKIYRRLLGYDSKIYKR